MIYYIENEGDMMFVLEICNNLGILGILFFIKRLLQIIGIVIPILLLLFLTIDFVKATTDSNPDRMDKVKGTAIKRIVYAVLVFLVPFIVNGFMSLLGNTNSFSACYDLANASIVNSLAEKNKLEQKMRNAKTEAQKQELAKRHEELSKKIEEQRKMQIKNTGGSFNPNAYVANQYTKSNGYISHATSASRGRYDTKGDQSGEEVSIAKNTLDWTYIARFKDPNKAELAARCMEAGAANDHIGYGVNDYTSLYYEAEKVNWDLSKITTDCNTVCSTFVAVCINAVGTGITKHLNGYSDSVKTNLQATGDFTFIDYDISKVMRGDVLVIRGEHVGMAV